ncbi:lysine-arginine-ornithine-binding periplasmic protein precursor [Vibrio variabilis]|uniref:Lysine-arginine-ornithine-binding periplasmic protein n=1 Tax=Vibrio variabilis TaxID=990271 RepID=A0ABQ0JH76_9VIBR|nr:lysine-arginine-ornithine-binding periplasmic protein precursor [Vibrio variabilis]
MKGKLKHLVKAATTAAIGLAVSFGVAASDTPNLDKINERGTLRVGMSTFVPWAMRDKQGELVGFEIDVAKRLAEDSGWKVEFVPTAWDGIIPALLSQKFDVIIGGLSITPERSKVCCLPNLTLTQAYRLQPAKPSPATFQRLKTSTLAV